MFPLQMIHFGAFMYTLLVRMTPKGIMIDHYRRTGDVEKEKEWIRKAEVFWSNNVCRHCDFEIEAEGTERLPYGPILYVANHEAYADILAFVESIQDRQIGFIAKDVLAKIPWYGRWIAKVRSLFIVREDPRNTLDLFNTGEGWLRDVFSLVIFPEGTRAKNNGMAEFQKGSLRMAFKAGVPIVPVTIKGTYDLFENQGYPRPGKARFYVHPHIETI